MISVPSLPANLCGNLQQVFLGIGRSTQDSIKQQMQQELTPEELQESRKHLFSLADVSQESQSQHGRDNVQGTNSIDQLVLKSRRSTEAIMDDIIELYLYLTDKRSKFPKTCLSSSKTKAIPNMESMIPLSTITKENVNFDLTTIHEASTVNDTNKVLDPEIRDLRNSIEDLRDEIIAMRNQFIVTFDLKLQNQTLENERKNLETAIELLTKEKHDHQHCCHIASQLSCQPNAPNKENVSEHSWTVVNNKRPFRVPRPSTSNLELTPPDTSPEPFVSCSNRFDGWTIKLDQKYQN